MAEINLRHYVQEIDDLIEEGEQLEMAIAHCRHILKSYPKHIDTYRLLGKAYLESKRYGDSADIFQRVLSAIPDDFVSHVGMAIIREDEGNIDSSIWHMERAAEAKPGNPAIEQELKRLMGKRDGFEPQRVRPSRGALARMYSHGELFSYASTELKRALEEDPERPDLQVLLATTYWKTDQRIEAAKLCSKILEKLPYCMDANRITAALLLESGKTQQANSYMRRLLSLDPYMAHLDNPMQEPHSIEARAVQIDRLSWTPGQSMPASDDEQPDWAASLGVDLHSEAESPQEEQVPTWLRSPEDSPEEDLQSEEVSPEESQPTIHPFAGAEPPPGAEIPDWMKDAGWVESDGTATEGPMDSAEIEPPRIEEVTEAEPISPDEFPDWLSDISTSERPPSETTYPPQDDDQISSEAIESESLDWIMEEAEEPSPASPLEPEIQPRDLISDEPSPDPGQFPPGSEQTESFEGLMETGSEPEAEPSEPASDPGDAGYFEEEGVIPPESQELPPWLEDDAPGASETIVTWLGDKSKDQPSSPSEDIPSWMRGTGPLIDIPEEMKDQESTEFEREPSPQAPQEDEPPLEEITDSLFEGVEPPSLEEILSGTDQVAESFESEEASPEGEPEPIGGTEEADTPGWLQEIADIEEEQLTKEPAETEQAPDWIKDLPVEEEGPPVMEREEGTPDWMSNEEDTQPSPVAEDVDFDQPSPEWLDDFAKEEPDFAAEPTTSEEKPEWLMDIAEAEAEVESKEDEPEPPEWLEGIKLPEEEKVEEPAEETPPGWIQSLAEKDLEDLDKAAAEEGPPEWITELAPEGEGEPAITEEDEPPDWVKTGVYDKPEITDLEAEDELTPADESSVEAEQELTPALNDVTGEEAMAGDEPEQVARPSLQAEEAPDWLVDISTTEAAEPSVPADEAPEWLQEVEISEIEAAFTPDVKEPEPVEPEEELREVIERKGEKDAWEPEFDEVEEEEPDTAELEAAEKEIESRLDWLEETAKSISPEPEPTAGEDVSVEAEPIDLPSAEVETTGEEIPAEATPIDPQMVESERAEEEIEAEVAPTEPPIAEVEVPEEQPRDEVGLAEETAPETGVEETPILEEIEDAVAAIDDISESIDTEIDDEEVSSFLEDLAKSEKQEEEAKAPDPDLDVPKEPAIEYAPERETTEEADIPEDVDAGLEWLEQLAGEDQVEEIESPELPTPSDEAEDAEVPEWLHEVAEGAEEFSDEDVEKEMLDTLEELEVQERDEPASEGGIDPSILETLVTRRSDLEEYQQERALDEEEPESTISYEEQKVDSVPTSPTDETVQDSADEADIMEDQPDHLEPPVEDIHGPEETESEHTPDVVEAPSQPMNMLDRARAAVQQGDIEQAVEHYVSLINQKIELEAVIEDLRAAVSKTPEAPILWQTLGDALMQSGEITDAIDAYRRGMEAV